MNIKQKDLIRVVSKTNGRCFYCNKIGEEIDHFISKYYWWLWKLSDYPANLGSVDQIKNLFLSCMPCNRSKKNQCPEDFIGNPVKAWSRYTRANFRVGLSKTKEYQW